MNNLNEMTNLEVNEMQTLEMHSDLFNQDCDAEVSLQHQLELDALNSRLEDMADYFA